MQTSRGKQTWADWVLCKVTNVDGQVVKMLPIGEDNGTEFSFTIPPNLKPPKVGDQYRFITLAAPKPLTGADKEEA